MCVCVCVCVGGGGGGAPAADTSAMIPALRHKNRAEIGGVLSFSHRQT